MELGLWMLLTLSVKDNRKKNKVSVEFNSRPRQILLGTFLVTCTILSYFSILSSFSESKPLSKLAHFGIFSLFLNYIHK